MGAEIGVFKGKFTPIILDATQPVKLHLIDPWYLHGLEWKWATGRKSTVAALCSIMKAHRVNLAAGKVVLHIGYDLDVLADIGDDYFDWVYLDTTHAYSQTCKELDILMRKVKVGGLIAGDDWRENPAHPHHGVCRAVREFVEREAFDLVYSSATDAQWAIRRK